MIVAAAVCPGAPFLAPGVSEQLARGSADLIAACAAAVRSLAAADRIVVLAAGRRPVVYPAGTVTGQAAVSALRRSDLAPRRCGPALSVGTIVGQALLDRAFPDGVPAPVDLVEAADDPVSTGAAVRHGSRPRDSLLVIADGAATHGDDAPGRRDDRGGPFDDALAAALAAGDPQALRRACADRDLARQLLAVTDPLLALATLTEADPPTTAELLFRDAPFGVGYLVATWRWSDS